MYNKTHFLKARERSNLASKSYTNLQRNYTRRKAVSNTECKLFYSLCKNCANVQMCSANCATVRQIHFYFFLGMTSVYSSWSHPERSTRRVDPLTPPPAGYTSIAGVLLCVTAHTSLPNVILFLSVCVPAVPLVLCAALFDCLFIFDHTSEELFLIHFIIIYMTHATRDSSQLLMSPKSALL